VVTYPLLQVMLKQDGGEYACIAEDRARYNLGAWRAGPLAVATCVSAISLTARVAMLRQR
jgi:hypothetical protein